jgi:hypothetical protein
MSQVQRTKDIELYVKKLGELLNVLYKRASDVESRLGSVNSELESIKTEMATLKTENAKAGEGMVQKQDYDQFTGALVEALKTALLAEEAAPESSDNASKDDQP